MALCVLDSALPHQDAVTLGPFLRGACMAGWAAGLVEAPCQPQNLALSSEQRLGVPREEALKVSVTHGALRASLHPGTQQPLGFCQPLQLWHPGHHLPKLALELRHP